LPVFERIEREFLQIQSSLAGQGTEVMGTVRVAVPDAFGATFLAPRLAAFAERYPAINLQLVPITRSFSLSQREADLAVMVGRPEKGRLVGRKLVDYTLGLYAARSYIERQGAPQRLEDLARHRLIGYVEDLISTPSLHFSREIFRDWRSILEITSAIGQLEAVRAGAGIGVLHDYVAVGQEQLSPVLPEVRLGRAYWLAWHPSLGDIPRVRAVIDFMTEIVQQSEFVYAAD
jgi:DNA-binding transcriptional LysR family regulator